MFPKKGLSAKEILSQLEAKKSNDIPWQSGKTFAFIYDAGSEAMDLVHKAFDAYLTENALDPTAFPSILSMEKDIVAMAMDLVNAPEGASGTFTSGGTESVMLMVKALRGKLRKEKPDIKNPEIVLPETAHCCFYKACDYFDFTPVSVKVDPISFLPNAKDMEAAITNNTVLLVCSAPSYAHGVIDPISDIAAIAQKHELFCHVDACVGGFYLPFAKQLGFDIPDFDFTVPGVTSMSMDLHKFGYAAKGASLILYRDGDLKKHQIFACATWSGYSVVNPTISSSRSGGPVAAAWAVLNFLGQEGYNNLVRPTMQASQKLIEGFNKIDGIKVLGKPSMNLIAIAAEDFNIFPLMEDLKERGWYLQAQLEYECSPANLHLTIGQANIPYVDELLKELNECVQNLRENPPVTEADGLPPEILDLLENITPEIFEEVSKMLGAGDGDMPERMDTVNSLLNQLSPQAREKILIEFVHKISS
jgi:glutamate/tyrosine decarboxylase-like PLP-dependent enzyme